MEGPEQRNKLQRGTGRVTESLDYTREKDREVGCQAFLTPVSLSNKKQALPQASDDHGQ